MITMGHLQDRMKALTEDYTRVSDRITECNRTLCALEGAMQDVQFWMTILGQPKQTATGGNVVQLFPSKPDGESK